MCASPPVRAVLDFFPQCHFRGAVQARAAVSSTGTGWTGWDSITMLLYAALPSRDTAFLKDSRGSHQLPSKLKFQKPVLSMCREHSQVRLKELGRAGGLDT